MVNGYIPNGLLSDQEASLARVLNHDRWSQAEARTSELLENIQPSHMSEMYRNDVVFYLKSLIMERVPCQVFQVGSVPLKTYLPDGDIDLTAFGEDQNLKDWFIPEVLDVLRNEERNEYAAFHVKEVQCIHAEVKIIKCMVDNFTVDISLHQLEGLSTLCFFEEADDYIGQNHLFKRSIILIKTWCHHESRILGSHHGLLSSYALEILVLYLFHVCNNEFAGPLEVLYRFLEFYSKFDWEHYCISLKGPVPKGSLPDMRAQPPLKDCQESLCNGMFFNDCISCYAMKSSSQESQQKPFVTKYIDIIDPLRANNNLGRSIGKGNFFRIRSAISYGAEQLEKLLDCPEENLLAHFDFIFKNTWARNGHGYWMDLHTYNLYIRNKVIITGTVTSDIEHKDSMKDYAPTDKGKSPMFNEVQPMHNFSGVCSSSELPHTYSEVAIQHYASSMTESQCSPTSSKYYTPASPSTSRTNHSSSSFSNGSSSMTSQPDEVRGDWIPHSASESVASYLQALQIASSYGPAFPDTHFLAGPSSSQRGVDNQRLSPEFEFPLYNYPIEIGSDMNAEPHGSTSENYAEQGSDPLTSDFGDYWLNLQYARLCQTAQSEGDLLYDHSIIAPFYLRDDRLRKKSSDFMNMMAHGTPLVAEMFNQYGNQTLGFWLPRITEGTGTFLPNPPSPIRYFERYNRKRLLTRLEQGNNVYESVDSCEEGEMIWNYNSGEWF